jgi:hypothetical protein
MDFLRDQMIASKFDLKAYLRMVYNTAAYQRAATVEEWTPGEAFYFPGPLLRRMSANQAWDSIVALVNDDPEAANWQEEVRWQLLLEDRERAGRAVSEDFEVLFDRARLVTDLVDAYERDRNELRIQLNAAELKGEDEAARRLRGEIGQRVANHRTQIRNISLTGSLTGELPPLPTAVELGLPNPADPITINERLAPEVVAELTRRLRERTAAQLAERGVTAPAAVQPALRFLAHVQTTFVRAVYLPQPAPGDHFLRVFGQSDREVIENANDEASLVQALTLMNSELLPKIGDPHAVLGRRLAQARSPRDKIDAMYRSLLSRPPTASEAEMFLQTVATNGKQAYADMLFALLNSREFLSVQ